MPVVIDAFDQHYLRQHRVFIAGQSGIFALVAIVVTGFAHLTSLEALRWLALLANLLPLPFLGIGFWWQRREPALRGLLALACVGTLGAWALTVGMWRSPGLGFGRERDITELIPDEARSPAVESIDREQAAILAAITRAQAQPTPAALRALVPYLNRDNSNLILPDGSARNTASLVREVMWSDPKLLYRSLDEEARAMAALLPADAVVPESVEVRVAQRLELALKTLIDADSEQRITTSFDVPAVGIAFTVARTDAEGQPTTSRREVGITYPFAGHFAGEVVEVNASSVDQLLQHLRKHLGY
jgi:hypothetical protein